MILTPADINPCIPANNLSTVYKHYGTYKNLCSATGNILETCCDTFDTATNLQHESKPIQELPKPAQ
ncbi:MAG: hypothetical protein Q8920_08525 [Bacillota bacterium]|nr:hypothetical protein [Bacillota bacterium]